MKTDGVSGKFAGWKADLPRLVAVLLISLVGLGAVIWLLLRPQANPRHVVTRRIAGAEAEAIPLYRGEIIEATGRERVELAEGRRYRVRIFDESREGTAGLARIGGMIVFIPDARKGETVVVEVLTRKRTTADARLLEREAAAPASPVSAVSPEAVVLDAAAPGLKPEEGGLYRGRLTGHGREGDGTLRLDGKTVYVKGAREGELVTFRVLRIADRYIQAETVDAPAAPAPSAAVRSGANASADDVQPGAVFDVEIVEPSRRNPDRDGVARIGGLIVIVPDSRPGQTVRIRIRDRQPRYALAERDTAEEGRP